MGVFRCWFDQVDVHDPEFTAAMISARGKVGLASKLTFFLSSESSL